MLSEEEKEAIEIVSNLKTYYEAYYLLSNEEIEENEEKNEAIKIVLNIIDRLQKENKEKEIILKDKQIDLMAEYINYLSDELVRETGKNELKFCDMEICVENDIDCEECIKQYFENKAKEE